MSILDNIQHENDIKKINRADYNALADEIRVFLLDKVSTKGGHLASNLGAVELTMALHLCMNFPDDKLIFDVGHQAYTHKLLTGRREGFDSLREFGGMSGFPKRSESRCDAFNTGHSSTSISAAMGFAVARDQRHGRERIAAVIGDGSMTGGMAYEALNNLSQLKTGCVIILNDNEMSIDKNVGGLSKYLNNIRVGSAYNNLKTGVEHSLLKTKAGEAVAKRLKRSKDNIKQFFVPGMFFEELGITYVGPIDGHNISDMVSTFEKAFRLNKPIIIHVKTKKGYGYRYAERHPDYFHGINAFDRDTGRLLEQKTSSTYTDIFSKYMVQLGKKNKDLVAVTAAMSVGTGLSAFAESFPDRFYDVGIAEQHAVTFAAGMAAAGLVPVVAVYSSFLQRAYDQLLHDVCLQHLHVILAVDRAGLVGPDGETHQGIYDISYLSQLPGMLVLAPKNRYEFVSMMDYAVEYDGPIAIRYPRGKACKCRYEHNAPIEYGKSELLEDGEQIGILVCGSMMEEADRLVSRLKSRGFRPMLVNVRFVSMIDKAMLEDMTKKCNIIVTMEDNITEGGYGERVSAAITDMELNTDGHIKHIDASIHMGRVGQGSIGQLRSALQIDSESIYLKVMAAVEV